ncbi:hypothetical protein OZK63_42095, partial [Streptomyces sp. UMAF16]|nr:hypothetical protein [Streptomyces sp. UMAF16]
ITATETAAIKVSDHITVLPDWENAQPPVLLPIMPYSNELLLGIVYAKLGNYDKAFELLQTQPTVLPHIDLLNRLH